MKFCDERIQKHLLKGGKIKRKLETHEVVIGFDKFGFLYDDDGDAYQFGKSDITADDWKIVEPDYDWNKIIEDKVLCVFCDNNDFKCGIISTLKYKDGDLYYDTLGMWFNYCKPFNPTDYNIAKDLKEYEK